MKIETKLVGENNDNLVGENKKNYKKMKIETKQWKSKLKITWDKKKKI